MKLLIIDNYDSFTYNLVYLVRKLTGTMPVVKRNDQLSRGEVDQYYKILISPGPGLPSEAGSLLSLLKEFGPRKSILGICLGHQAIGCIYGAGLINMDTVFHGRATPVNIIRSDSLFSSMPEWISVGRYHSWTLSKDRFPDCLEVLAEDACGQIMAVRHKQHDVKGLQFHPESIMTPNGEQIIANWLKG